MRFYAGRPGAKSSSLVCLFVCLFISLFVCFQTYAALVSLIAVAVVMPTQAILGGSLNA